VRALQSVRARAAAFARALAAFVRGFAGLTRLPANPAAARRALEERCARRRSCC
jgi:hypothetical protein